MKCFYHSLWSHGFIIMHLTDALILMRPVCLQQYIILNRPEINSSTTEMISVQISRSRVTSGGGSVSLKTFQNHPQNQTWFVQAVINQRPSQNQHPSQTSPFYLWMTSIQTSKLHSKLEYDPYLRLKIITSVIIGHICTHINI